MDKHILIVDDDQEMLAFLKEGLKAFDSTLTIEFATDGLKAVKRLEENSFSLVITDLKMPRMDGISLLGHIMNHYPDIPVIVITAYSTPVVEKVSKQKGALGYIQKPFMIKDLATKIRDIFKLEADGGTLRHFTATTFMQLVEMEQRTCTLRMMDNQTRKQGVLFFRQGHLLDARLGNVRGEEAAYEILSWDKASLTIQNQCVIRSAKITTELTELLLESMRRKDERSEQAQSEAAVVEKKIAPEAPPQEVLAEHLARLMKKSPFVTELAVFDSLDGLLIDEFESVAVHNLMPSLFFDSAQSMDHFHAEGFSEFFLIDMLPDGQYLLFERFGLRGFAGLKEGLSYKQLTNWIRSEDLDAETGIAGAR